MLFATVKCMEGLLEHKFTVEEQKGSANEKMQYRPLAAS